MTPIERATVIVDEAIRHGSPIYDTPDPKEVVRKVLLAFREPSEVMVKTFVDHALNGDVLSHGGWPGYARDQWQAMIDAALAE